MKIEVAEAVEVGKNNILVGLAKDCLRTRGNG